MIQSLFKELAVERETGFEPASGTDGSGYRVAYRLARTS
jgi:hypothetical protein